MRRSRGLLFGVVVVLAIAGALVLGRGDAAPERAPEPVRVGPREPGPAHSPDLTGRTTGPAWTRMVAAADALIPIMANVADQNSDHDIQTLAAGLVYRATGSPKYRELVVASTLTVVGTEQRRDSHCQYEPNRARSLAVGRNLPGYVLAAHLVGLTPGSSPEANRFASWVDDVRKAENCPNTGSGRYPEGKWLSIAETHDESASNGSALAGGARIAAAAYLGDTAELDRAWATFRRYSGDRRVGPDLDFTDNGLSWSSQPKTPVAVNPAGATLQGRVVDGALVNDLGRGGPFRWPPAHTRYPWEGLQGYFLQAFLLDRAGYPAWEIQDRAPLRALLFLHRVWQETEKDKWWEKSDWVKHLAERVYGIELPISGPADSGQNFAWTDWIGSAQS